MTLLLRVLAYLDKRAAPTALIGGMALAVHGVARATYDRDLLLTDRRVLDAKFWQQWSGGQEPEIRIGDADDPLAGVVSLHGDGTAVDLVVGREAWMARAITRSTKVALPEGVIPVVDRGDLVALKLYAGGPQDLLDVALLLEADPNLRQLIEDRLPELPQAICVAWNSIRAKQI